MNKIVFRSLDDAPQMKVPLVLDDEGYFKLKQIARNKMLQRETIEMYFVHTEIPWLETKLFVPATLPKNTLLIFISEYYNSINRRFPDSIPHFREFEARVLEVLNG
jgi:hypothetical protein